MPNGYLLNYASPTDVATPTVSSFGVNGHVLLHFVAPSAGEFIYIERRVGCTDIWTPYVKCGAQAFLSDTQSTLALPTGTYRMVDATGAAIIPNAASAFADPAAALYMEETDESCECCPGLTLEDVQATLNSGGFDTAAVTAEVTAQLTAANPVTDVAFDSATETATVTYYDGTTTDYEWPDLMALPVAP